MQRSANNTTHWSTYSNNACWPISNIIYNSRVTKLSLCPLSPPFLLSFFILFRSFLRKRCGRFCVQTYAWVRPCTCIHWYKFENDEEERILSCTWTVLCYILQYIYIGQIAKRRTRPVFAVNVQNTPKYSFCLGTMFDRVLLVASIRKTLSKRGQITANISNFLSHFVFTDMPGANRKSNIWIFIIHTKIVGRKVLTHLVTFKFRCTHFLFNRKGNLNGKILNNDTKKQQLHIVVYIYDHKMDFCYFTFI